MIVLPRFACFQFFLPLTTCFYALKQGILLSDSKEYSGNFYTGLFAFEVILFEYSLPAKV
jgi:hypothetical protein